MDLIDQFISHYRREFDFFEQAGRLVAQQLDARLQASGIRAMVISRAKSPKRLEDKIRQRAVNQPYGTLDAIYEDIVDLAGVRVALYFPGERKEISKIIREQFNLTSNPKEFTGTSHPSYEKRFSGYWATHYRLQLREANLQEADLRYADARIAVVPLPNVLQTLGVFTLDELAEINQIRRLRNNLVHGVEVPDPEFIYQDGQALQRILERLASDSRPDVKQAAEYALGRSLQ